MGGIGFIETNKAEVVRDKTLTNMLSIEAARKRRQALSIHIERLYLPVYKQKETEVTPLREEDAYPADAEDYGWEKLPGLGELYTRQEGSACI
jgi:GDP-D-mannose 3',5'-epimerase